MQAEQEFVRDFCPNCMQKTMINALSCEGCGTSDLIPTPPSYQGMEATEQFKETFEESKLELDPIAVDKLLNDPFGFLTGLAGTGKSTLINELNRLHPDLFEICATTGIAAVNLNAKTINSTLKFFNTRSLENAWREQLLHMNLRLVRARKKILLIDEVSMLDAYKFDLIMNAVDDINSDGTGKQLGVWLTGDICQLPPIPDKDYQKEELNGKLIFRSNYWKRFEDNMVRLTKVWRQDDIDFLEAINLVRRSKGTEAVQLFQKCGVNIISAVNNDFEGTTLIPKNAEVDFYNTKKLNQLTTPLIRVTAESRGVQAKEWQRLIPFELRLKEGALVMILANQIPDFNYVNGDLGIIQSYNEEDEEFLIKLKRNNKMVRIGRIMRPNLSDDEPMYKTGNFQHYLDMMTGQWVIGTIRYFPLRLAYASTIHKSQGLSLDAVQIDTRGNFFSAPSMAYVAISRARSPKGLTLVGTPESIAAKMNMAKEVQPYV